MLLSMSILIFMVSDKMPSTSSFVPLIGWFYTSMMLLISLGTWASAVVISVQKKGIMGKRPPMRTMRWARKLGKLLQVEMPLLMKQAYVLKAKQEKLMKQNSQRRGSLWARSWQKLSNSRSATPGTNSTLVPPSSDGNNIGLTRLASFQRQQQQMELSALSVDEGDEDLIVDDWEGTPVPATPTRLQPNGEVWPPEPPESPPRRSHSAATAPLVRAMSRKATIIPEISLDGNPTITLPQGQQRTLAEIEYDWLAEVIERIFLLIFIILFLICGVGTNMFGFYHWMMTKQIDKIVQ
uniref:Neur_chan_memb domain-containing protein n=1 Tax=Bursaphelenchus xylophilus TaxID=6326 RepID=A0A1I7SVG5_BURXY